MALDGTLIFGTSIDESGFEKGVSSLTVAAGTAIGNIAANMVSQISNAVAQIPAQMVSVGSSFEASMSQVAATMGITSAAAEFKTLSDAAKEMGESTKFSASQAGEALNYLALAGYDAEKPGRRRCGGSERNRGKYAASVENVHYSSGGTAVPSSRRRFEKPGSFLRK